jgi:hypothetical protein
MQNLSVELLHKILSYGSNKDNYRLKITCKTLNNAFSLFSNKKKL